MRDLSIVMDNLRLVQRARRSFLKMWTVERELIDPMLDRMADDLQDVTAPGAEDDPQRQPPPAGAGD